MALLSALASSYLVYYQATNLSDEDMGNIIDGYYYLLDLEQELEAFQGEKMEPEHTKTLNFLVISLAGYSVKSASTLNTVEGQRLLNRYYKEMAEFGINVSRRSDSLTEDSELVTESLADLEKVQGHQANVLKFFKVNEEALKAQK